MSGVSFFNNFSSIIPAVISENSKYYEGSIINRFQNSFSYKKRQEAWITAFADLPEFIAGVSYRVDFFCIMSRIYALRYA